MFIHGHRAHKRFTFIYNSWRAMKQRCNNPKASNYRYYGARGIKYDPRWESFEAFYNDMGEWPRDAFAYDLAREKQDKDYSYENCFWCVREVNRYLGG